MYIAVFACPEESPPAIDMSLGTSVVVAGTAL